MSSAQSRTNSSSVVRPSHLSGSDLYVEVVPLVRNLEYFRPSKTVYPKSVFVDQEAIGTHTEHDVHTFRIL